MCSIIPRKVFDALMAKIPKRKADQPTVNVHIHVTALNANGVEDLLRKHGDTIRRQIASDLKRERGA
jgi:hypothetical protein